jgi:hypothetical protein
VLNFPVEDVEPTVDRLAATGVRFEHYDGELQTDEKGIFRGQGPDHRLVQGPGRNILSVLEVEGS